MGRGSSGGGDLPNGGGGLDPNSILDTKDMISNRLGNEKATDQCLTVARDMYNEYGEHGVLPGSLQIATLKPGARALGYFDGDNIAINKVYFSDKMTAAYDKCIESGYHPKRGSKSAIEAVTAHEYGHSLAGEIGKRSGTSLDTASREIVQAARKNVLATRGNKTDKGFAGKISRYATESYAECVAEALADVYCNGKKAAKESQAIAKEVKRRLK